MDSRLALVSYCERIRPTLGLIPTESSRLGARKCPMWTSPCLWRGEVHGRTTAQPMTSLISLFVPLTVIGIIGAVSGMADPFPVRLECGEGVVTFRLRSKPVATYRGGPGTLPAGVPEAYRRGGYLHPLVTPGGTIVSADYPKNHLHHHGVWTAWTHTRFAGRAPDFWNMGQKQGRVEMVQWLGGREAADGAEIETLHRSVDLTAESPTTVLLEGWKIRVPATPPGTPYRIDLTIRQTNVTELPLALPEYRYGGLGYRGLDAWDGAAKAHFRTSEGITNRVAGNESRGRWCWIGGAVSQAGGGEVGGVGAGVAGVVLMAHPSNFRFPESMRIHPTEPFFCWSPQQQGDFTLAPGAVHRMRYRILLADGPPDPDQIEREWTEWSKVP